MSAAQEEIRSQSELKELKELPIIYSYNSFLIVLFVLIEINNEINNMIDLRRKLHNLTHPMLGRILMLHRVVEHRSDDPAQRELEVTPDFQLALRGEIGRAHV